MKLWKFFKILVLWTGTRCLQLCNISQNFKYTSKTNGLYTEIKVSQYLPIKALLMSHVVAEIKSPAHLAWISTRLILLKIYVTSESWRGSFMLVAVIWNAHQVFLLLSCQQPSIFSYNLFPKGFKFWNNFSFFPQKPLLFWSALRWYEAWPPLRSMLRKTWRHLPFFLPFCK